ncbi:hypothetical protein GE061_011880 [Apolygus lucorum]|uniref:Uncharacterized protein n=1 Tax=Apolygus lucorum TaxID=248454 RepID=A0A8S9XT06_APOLU|nr:hypothetical protein GE061_011880 [Apolygus lucorum]
MAGRQEDSPPLVQIENDAPSPESIEDDVPPVHEEEDFPPPPPLTPPSPPAVIPLTAIAAIVNPLKDILQENYNTKILHVMDHSRRVLLPVTGGLVSSIQGTVLT